MAEGFETENAASAIRPTERSVATENMTCSWPRLVGSLLLVASACSVWIQPDRQQCSVDNDCRTAAASVTDAVCIDAVCQENPNWSCLDRGFMATPVPTSSGVSMPATVTLHFIDLVNETPAVGVRARLCHKLDFDCTQPIASGLGTDADGKLVLTLSTGFDGYVELQGPDRMPGIYFFYPPVDGDRDIPDVPLVRPTDLQMFASLAGRPIVANRGHVLLGSYNCLRQPAEGVHLSSESADTQSTVFYLIKKVPLASANTTDSSGRGGIINLHPGSVSIAGDLLDTRHVGEVGVLVRAGTITYTSLFPVPQ